MLTRIGYFRFAGKPDLVGILPEAAGLAWKFSGGLFAEVGVDAAASLVGQF